MRADSDIKYVKAKLEQARSALDKMRREERKAFSDRAEFNHLLSDFLSAGRSVDYRLCHEYSARYIDWREKWNEQNQSEDRILKSMHDRRDDEVHERGAGHIVKDEQIKIGVGGSYGDPGGPTLEVMGSPTPLMGDSAGAIVTKPRYIFEIDGTEQPVTEVCAEYLAVLDRLVADFEAENA
jgi:hypothetical protein